MGNFQDILKQTAAQTTGRQYRFLIVNEHYLGHTSVHRLFCKALTEDPEVDFNPERDTVRLDVVETLLERVQRRLASLRFPNRWIRQQDLDLHRWRFQRFIALLARKRVEKKLRQCQYDAIAFHSQTASYASLDLMDRYPVLISTDITNTQASEEWNHPWTRWTFWSGTMCERQAFKKAKAVAVFSEWARQAVLKENPGVHPEKVRCYPPGAELDPLLAIPLHRCESQKLRLLFVGGDFKRKGGEDVLAVFREQELHRTCELHLVSAGAPVEAENLPGVFVYRNIRAYTPEWIARYAAADVFILPTLNEAYGHVFVEAMAAGLPVIATHINAIPEIVGEVGAEFLVPRGDHAAILEAIRHLHDDPALRLQLGRLGRERTVTHFDASVCFGRYVAWLKEISSG